MMKKQIALFIILFVALCGCNQEVAPSEPPETEQDIRQDIEQAVECSRQGLYKENIYISRDSNAIYVTCRAQNMCDNNPDGGWLATYTNYSNPRDGVRGCLRIGGSIETYRNRTRISSRLTYDRSFAVCVNDEMEISSVLLVAGHMWGEVRNDYEYECREGRNEEFCNEMQGVFNDWSGRLSLSDRIREGMALPEVPQWVRRDLAPRDNFRPIPERLVREQEVRFIE